MKITIDKEKCIGCGSCVAVCDESFEMNNDNKARLKEKGEDAQCVKEAVDICPVQAIEISETP